MARVVLYFYGFVGVCENLVLVDIKEVVVVVVVDIEEVATTCWFSFHPLPSLLFVLLINLWFSGVYVGKVCRQFSYVCFGSLGKCCSLCASIFL